jgi:hypothetical protein
MYGKANHYLSQDCHQTLYGWKSPTADWVLTKKVKETKMFCAQNLVIFLIFTGPEIAYATRDVEI